MTSMLPGAFVPGRLDTGFPTYESASMMTPYLFHPRAKMMSFVLIAGATLTITTGCKKKTAEPAASEAAVVAPEGAGEEAAPAEEVVERLSPVEAFGAFDLPALHAKWEGLWVLPTAEIWRVRENFVGRTYTSERLRRDGFVLASPCSMVVTKGEQGGDGVDRSFNFLSDGESLWTLRGTAGLLTADGAVACHDGHVTVLDAEGCKLWTSTWVGTGDEANLMWTSQESRCSFEEKEAEGATVRAFLFRNAEGHQEVLRVQDKFLHNPNTILEKVEGFEDQNEARARYNELARPHMADKRKLDEVMAHIKGALSDKNKGGTYVDPWFAYDTGSHYEDVQTKDCTFSARRVFHAEQGEEVVRKGELVTIDFAEVDGTRLGEEEVILIHTKGARAHVGRVVQAGEKGVTLANCVSAEGAAWSCEPVEGQARGLMVQTGQEANELLQAMRRAVTLCIAED